MNSKKIASVIAAAGVSRRMGEPKSLLDWFGEPVIAVIARRLTEVAAMPTICVTGPHDELIQFALKHTSVQCLFNSDSEQTGMLTSYQLGLQTLIAQEKSEKFAGALFVLGDLPHIPTSIYRAVLDAAKDHSSQLVFPSIHQRRGHPFFVPRTLWDDLLQTDQAVTMRNWVNDHSGDTHYVIVESDAILHDMDTPDDYEKLKTLYAQSESS
jgi:molybdenum cofactor cytidylyltransferase